MYKLYDLNKIHKKCKFLHHFSSDQQWKYKDDRWGLTSLLVMKVPVFVYRYSGASGLSWST